MSKIIEVIVRRPKGAGESETPPFVEINGKPFTVPFETLVPLPESVVLTLENSLLTVERISESEQDEQESPADTDGNGDGAAEGPGGADGGAETIDPPIDAGTLTEDEIKAFADAQPEPRNPTQDEVNAITAARNPLDHDGDGAPGGSLPKDPPALTGKTKAELEQIAKDEGVDLSEAKNNGDRIALIEASRAKAKPAEPAAE